MRNKEKINKINTFSRARYLEIVEYIEKIPQFVKGTGVQRSKCMLEAMGNPQNRLKIIHIAGTNGKGSVCCYLERILRENNYKTGLFTSPHLEEIRERIKINGCCISEELFAEGFEAVRKAELTGDVRYSYFDYLFGIAVYSFAACETDYVIMETGLGGRLDSTNAAEHPIISIITSISLEHTAVLGDTVTQIAAEKAGIIKPGSPLIYLDDNKEVSAVIKEKAEQCGVKYIGVRPSELQIHKNNGNNIDFSIHNEYYKNDYFAINTAAVYQVQNCALALMAAAVLSENKLAALDGKISSEAVKKASWPGRMEQILPDIYVDGAHNPAGIRALIETVAMIKNERRCILLFSVVNDKNYEQMIFDLCKSGLFEEFIVTELDGARQLDRDSIRNVFKKYTNRPVSVYKSVETALEKAAEKAALKDTLLFCAGSLYLVGDIKKIIG